MTRPSTTTWSIFARTLPKARETVDEHLGGRRPEPASACWRCAVRLLDLGFFRVGGEAYAEDNGTYGLATMQQAARHACTGDVVVFDYPAKSGKHRIQAVVDPSVDEVVRALLKRARRRRRAAGLQGRDGAGTTSARADINAYLKEVIGEDVSAKDFRTWHATVLAAVALAVSDVRAAPKTRASAPSAAP